MRSVFQILLISLLSFVHVVVAEEPQGNLLKNGSFEGSSRYWYETEGRELVSDAAHGQYALKINKGGIQSAAFPLVQGKPVNISFSAKSLDGAATAGWQCTPCSREIGAKAGLTWGMRGKHPVKLTTEWKRYTFTFTPNLAQDGFWPRPTFMMQLGDCDKPFLLDAVTVAYGTGADAYIPRREIEVANDCVELKGYAATSNLLQKGQTVNLTASASNPGAAERAITLKWSFLDYEGETTFGGITEKKITIPAGKTVRESIAVPLPATGLILARVAAFDGDKLLDSSDLPLTSLPYEKAATKPDFRERFGGSYFGPHSLENGQRIGFAWSRWYPHNKWETMQKDGADSWNFLETTMDALQSHGMSQHVTLYARPKWAFDKDFPLPKDMLWPATDPRWEDFSIKTKWDIFVSTVVEKYKGRSVVYEIENEPEFDGWEKTQELKDQYVSFTRRTAKLIKKTDPVAKVQIDNVYGIPSGLNNQLLATWNADKHLIDEISWHDYHDGWLADAATIKRMRARLDELGFGHVEIWFNEGWSYTNTAQDEPALALTSQTSSSNTNALVCSVAELTANGQKKTVLFHTGYEDHGMSFWDYAGPGTMLWDYNGYALPVVAAWNTLCHHVGLSEETGFVRPPGANFCIFQDLRNKRGVMVAYADRESKNDVTVELPFADLAAEDIMGNAVALNGNTLVLKKNGRPVYLYSTASTDGKTFTEKMTPLDRKNASFVSKGGAGGAGANYKLPPAWEGKTKDSTEGNPAMADGKPIWRLDQVYPSDPSKIENYRPMAWHDGWWIALKDGSGGQPKVEFKDSAIRMEFRAPRNDSPHEKLSGLAFIAPAAGTYTVSGNVEMRLWDKSKNGVTLTVLKKSATGATLLDSKKLEGGKRVEFSTSTALAAGEELVLLPRIDGMFAGGDATVRDLAVNLGGGGAEAAGGLEYRLPLAWEGTKKSAPEGNPITLDGKPVWRVDQVWPDNPIFTANYTPLLWNGTQWIPEKNGMGGQPSVVVGNGSFHSSVRGSWSGKGNEGQRIAGLCFVAPKSAIYRVTGSANSKPWEGGAKVFKLGIFKKDTQRSSEVKTIELPRSGDGVPLNFTVELTAGHELVFLPLMPDWHNATTTSVEDLVIREEK